MCLTESVIVSCICECGSRTDVKWSIEGQDFFYEKCMGQTDFSYCFLLFSYFFLFSFVLCDQRRKSVLFVCHINRFGDTGFCFRWFSSSSCSALLHNRLRSFLPLGCCGIFLNNNILCFII